MSNTEQMTLRIEPAIEEEALEAAARRIYEDKGDRKGVIYVGWDHEPAEVRGRWIEDVRVSVSEYLANCKLAHDLERALADVALWKGIAAKRNVDQWP